MFTFTHASNYTETTASSSYPRTDTLLSCFISFILSHDIHLNALFYFH
jgi:hypothetical protein